MSADPGEDTGLPRPKRVEQFTVGFNFRTHFPAAEFLVGAEGGAVYTAQQDGAYFIISDESTLAEFLEPGDPCVTVYTFGAAADRDRFCSVRYAELLKRAEARRDRA